MFRCSDRFFSLGVKGIKVSNIVPAYKSLGHKGCVLYMYTVLHYVSCSSAFLFQCFVVLMMTLELSEVLWRMTFRNGLVDKTSGFDEVTLVVSFSVWAGVYC